MKLTALPQSRGGSGGDGADPESFLYAAGSGLVIGGTAEDYSHLRIGRQWLFTIVRS